MKKISIKIKINDYTIENEGTIDNEVLKVESNNEDITYDLKKQLLTKTNNDLKISLDFKNKVVFYELIKEKQQFSNNFTIFSLTNSPKQVIIKYRIEDTDFYLQIDYETI